MNRVKLCVFVFLLAFFLRGAVAGKDKDKEEGEEDACGDLCQALIGAGVHLAARLISCAVQAMLESDLREVQLIGCVIAMAITLLFAYAVYSMCTELSTPRERRQRRARLAGAAVMEGGLQRCGFF